VLAFVAPELYLRTVGSHRLGGVALYHGLWENDGQGDIRPVPGFVKTDTVAGKPFTYRMNALGLRGPEVAVKSPNELRILVLGDSVAFGHGVEDSETFSARLAPRLSSDLGRSVTFGNGALPMNGEVDQVRDLRRLKAPFAPDAVLCCIYLGNDFVDNYYGPKEVVAGFVVNTQMARFYRSSPRARAMFHSRVAFEVELWLTEKLPSLAIKRYKLEPTAEEAGRFADLPGCSWDEGLFMDVMVLTPELERVLDKVEEALAQVQKLAGVPVLALILPSKSRVWPGEYAKALSANNLDTAAHRFGLAQARVTERCQRIGMPVLDATPWLRQAQVDAGAPDATLIPGDFHLSPNGHAVVAHALAPWIADVLRQQGVLK
jgi:hypothetical protein